MEKMSEATKEKRIVVIGGGTGVFTVLSGLNKHPVHLSAIVSMADDGGSTGLLREEFGILPPGDVRRALVALAKTDYRLMSELFNYRFSEGLLSGHNFGNLFITALERLTGNFEKAIYEAGKVLAIQGEVIPVTLDSAKLYAELENGVIVSGETNIDIPKHDPSLKIKKVFLRPVCEANSRAIEAVKKADLIVLGPGDLYTSLIPNLLVKGIISAVRGSKAKKVYLCNLMTKLGETNNFTALDFVNEIENYLGKAGLNYFVVNKTQPAEDRLRRYAEEKAILVEHKKSDFKGKKYKTISADLLRKTGFIRHDPDKLAKLLLSLI